MGKMVGVIRSECLLCLCGDKSRRFICESSQGLESAYDASYGAQIGGAERGQGPSGLVNKPRLPQCGLGFRTARRQATPPLAWIS